MFLKIYCVIHPVDVKEYVLKETASIFDPFVNAGLCNLPAILPAHSIEVCITGHVLSSNLI